MRLGEEGAGKELGPRPKGKHIWIIQESGIISCVPDRGATVWPQHATSLRKSTFPPHRLVPSVLEKSLRMHGREVANTVFL